jgi:hypothetical protein
VALELIRAILVAILVLAVPGHLWAGVLAPSADKVERLTFSVALSAVLVPSCALLLARFFGPGITLPIALASVGLVTLSGIPLDLKLGAASRVETCVETRQLPLSAATLAPLAAAAAVIIASIAGVVDVQRTWMFIALLILAAAVLQQWAARVRGGRSEEDSKPGPAKPPPPVQRDAAHGGAPLEGEAGPGRRHSPFGGYSRRWRGGTSARRRLLLAVLLLTLARGYVGPVLREWPYIRGQDQYAHSVMTNLVLARGSASDFLVYPPGFHVLSAVLTRLSGLQPLELYPLLAPALLLLPTLACYVLADRLFGPDCALGAAFFAGVILNSPFLFVLDGTYVDLVAAQFLLVLSVVSIVLLLFRPSPRFAVLLGVLGSGVVLYHSVATIYLTLLLALVSLLFLPYLLWRDRRRGVALLGGLALVGVISLCFAWDTYHVPQTVAAFFGRAGTTDTANHAAMAIGTQRPRNAALVLAHISQPVGWFGLLGVLLLAPALRRLRSAGLLSLALLLGWTLIFFAASRTSLSGFPVRFTRDLGIPLSVAAGFALVTLLRSLDRRRPATIVAGAVIVLSLLAGFQQSVARAVEPSIVVFMNPQIEAAGRWLRAHNEGGNIIVSPHRNQVPGNAMLAMGGYSALPSYSGWQLQQRRQVPFRDRQAVQDTLWVVKHPRSRAALEILSRHDVRYVVLYKKLREGSYWFGADPVQPDPFLRKPHLYTVVFENDYVVIFKVNLNE